MSIFIYQLTFYVINVFVLFRKIGVRELPHLVLLTDGKVKKL